MRETWSVNGTPLTQYASQVERLDLELTPKLRGADRQYIYAPGAAFRPRVADSRSLTLGMLVQGQALTTDRAAYPAQHDRAVREIAHLFRPGGDGQFDLTRTWTDDQGTHTATAKGVCDDPLVRARYGSSQSKLTVDIFLPDPYFYGAPVTVNIPAGATRTITLPGDEATTAITLTLNGQLQNATVTNETPNPDVSVKVGTAIAAGDKVTVDVDRTTVRRTSDGANIIGALTHTGARPWFQLHRGTNTVHLSATSGTGSCDLTYRPVHH